jgi:hypothetical protein
MEFRKKVSILGIITGSIAAVLGRTIVIFVMGIFIDILLAASGAEVPANTGYTNPLIMSLAFVVSSLISILGGYIAAYIAKHDELLNGALSSFLPMLFAICTLFSDPLYLAILTLIISPLLALFGGYLRLKQRARKQSPQSGASMNDFQPQEPQPEQTPIDRSINSQGRTGKLSPLIRLSGIVIVISIIWSFWFGWSSTSFVGPGFIILLGYGIFRLFGKGSPRPTGGHQE